MGEAIEFQDLRVSYRTRRGRVDALAGLDLSVPTGGVFGFLGANGAGKTTAIRAAVGLLRGARGRVNVLGESIPRGLPAAMDRVGALVEQPSFFPNFTGRRNLELLGRTRGIGPKRIDATLERVGLGARADSRFATYSLGMKQRLGIAAALMKDPELLILDEPANGLDPPGILEVRTLMRSFAAEGRTVFVSSHILAEVEHACDRVAIVAHGKCIASGRVSDLLQGANAHYRVRVDDPRAREVLTSGGWTVEPDGDGTMVVAVDASRSHEVTGTLAHAGIYLSELTPIARSLEDVFLELTEEPS
ncbi:MAG: type transport system ATP-binding protein [Actinomycetota bacterium]|nr:type transport system ATP-binding protein [Actinomycetota bacterium]